MFALAVVCLCAVNVWTFACFGIDKERARDGRWRIAERDLLGLALCGGSAGALLGRQVFRHKTRKEPFATQLMAITVLQVGAAAGWGLAMMVP